jgi:hypothetical protein
MRRTLMQDETTNSQPPAAGTGLSRRGFMYGTTAAAAGAVLLPRLPRSLSHPAGHTVLPSGRVVPLVGSSGAFKFNQAGPAGVGPDASNDLTLTVSGTAAGSLLVATMVSEDASPAGAFTALTPGWRLARAAPGPSGSGRAEIWYYPGTPGTSNSIGSPGGDVTAKFKTSAGTTCRGVISEYGVPTGLNMIGVLDATGKARGTDSGNTGGTFSLTPAAGNMGHSLGIAVAGDFFSKAVSGGWTAPSSGWTPIRALGGTVTAPWASWYDVNLLAGVQQPIVASYSDTNPPTGTVEKGWAFAFAAFRGVVFPGIYLDGGEQTNIVALDPTGQELILGGDVEGMWRSADFGNHWQLSQDGIWGSAWRCTASVAWSQTVAAEVYACVGKNASATDGGFMVSTDGGVTWSMRAPATKYTFLNFQANTATAVLPNGEGNDEDRSVGHLIAQDPTPGNSFLYVATYNSGIARSPANSTSQGDGFSWGQIGLSNGNFYARALAIDPGNLGTLYAGLWKYTNPSTLKTFGGLYVTTDANNTTQQPTWNPVGSAPSGVPVTSTVSDVKVLGGNVYVTFTQFGVYLYKPSTGAWFTLVSDPSYGLWTGLDVYQSGTDTHVVVAVCGSNTAQGSTGYKNVLQITVTASSGMAGTPVDLTGSATINSGNVPPDNQPWWHGSDQTFQNWLGAQHFRNGHVLVNPDNTKQIFVTGASGCFRTDDASVSPVVWDVAVTGAPMIAALNFATDPNQPEHFVVCGTDYTFIDVLNDNTGFGAATTVLAPTGKLESRAASFDRRASIVVNPTTSYSHVVYVATNQKFAQNSTGDVQWTSDDHVWRQTGLGAAMVKAGFQDNAVTGVYAGNPGSGPYVVAAVIGNGIWKSAIPADPAANPTQWSWSQVDPNVGTAGTKVQRIPIVANATGATLYCFDCAAGIIYRAKNNAGGHWVPIWTVTDTVGDERSGWLAVNPTLTSADELWVATSQRIWKLPDASIGTVVGNQIKPADWSASSFPQGCGGLAFTATSGTLYAVSLNGMTQTSAQLLSLANGGAATAWAPGDPGNSFGSYVSWPGPAAMTIAGSNKTQTLLVGSNPNLGIYGIVGA